jgi:hypothetical protein
MEETGTLTAITVKRKTLDEASKVYNANEPITHLGGIPLLLDDIAWVHWTADDWDRLSIHNLKTDKDGTTSDLAISGTIIADMHLFIPVTIGSDDLLKKFKAEMKEFVDWKEFNPKSSVHGEKIVVELDNISEEDEVMLQDAKAMKQLDQKEILAKNGFVRGAIVQRGQDEWHRTYGIFTGHFYESEGDTVGLSFTDGQQFHQDYCNLVDDVNKEILRMVEAEQGRVMEDAHKFVDLMSQKLQEVIYE